MMIRKEIHVKSIGVDEHVTPLGSLMHFIVSWDIPKFSYLRWISVNIAYLCEGGLRKITRPVGSSQTNNILRLNRELIGLPDVENSFMLYLSYYDATLFFESDIYIIQHQCEKRTFTITTEKGDSYDTTY